MFELSVQWAKEALRVISLIDWFGTLFKWGACVLRYCRNVHPTWVKFDSKDTKESGSVV